MLRWAAGDAVKRMCRHTTFTRFLGADAGERGLAPNASALRLPSRLAGYRDDGTFPLSVKNQPKRSPNVESLYPHYRRAKAVDQSLILIESGPGAGQVKQNSSLIHLPRPC